MSLFLRNFLRGNEYKTALGPLVIILLVLHLLLIGTVAGLFMEHWLAERMQVQIELQSQASEQQKKEFFSGLQQQTFVSKSRYITKAELFADARRKDPAIVKFVEDFKLPNPFSDTVALSLRSSHDYTDLIHFAGNAHWASTVKPTFLAALEGQQEQSQMLSGILQTVVLSVVGITLLLGLVMLFFVFHLVHTRVRSHHKELKVLREAGARLLQLHWPFLVEAFSLLLAALIISVVVVIASVAAIGLLVLQTLHIDVVTTVQTLLPLLPMSLLLLGVEWVTLLVVGICGGLLATFTMRHS